MMRRVKAIIERASDGRYSVYMDVDDMDYLVTGTASTAEEAIKVFTEGYEDTRRFYAEEGKTLRKLNSNMSIYDMASFLSYFSKVFSLAGFSRVTGINKSQLSHYMTGHRTLSINTVHKIQDSLQQFAKELSQVHFV